MPLNLIWLEQATHPVVPEAPGLRLLGIRPLAGEGASRMNLPLRSNRAPPPDSPKERQSQSPGRIAGPSLAAEMRAGERWPGKLPLLRRRRKKSTEGTRWDRRKRTGWTGRSARSCTRASLSTGSRRRRSKRRPSWASSRSSLGRPTSGSTPGTPSSWTLKLARFVWPSPSPGSLRRSGSARRGARTGRTAPGTCSASPRRGADPAEDVESVEGVVRRPALAQLQGQDGRGGDHDTRAPGRVLAAMISRPPSCREPPAAVWPAITIAVVA